jgi:membrane protein implicated in regulation of membrane protease activity
VTAFFLACAAIGGAVLLVQVVLGVLGLHHAGPDLGHALGHGAGAEHEVSDGLDLLSVRALAAGAAFFGVTGGAVLAAGGAPWLALPAAAAVGGAAMVGVAHAMRSMLRLEDDGTVRIEGAVGQEGTVYLRIPGARSGVGKVLLNLQGRTVELQAVTPEAELPTGSSVIVVDVVGPDTVEVVVTPTVGEIFDAGA